MDKRADGLAGAMREIAEQRDKRLGGAGEISADRLEELEALLAMELPVETALLTAARQRDESLSLPEPALPAVVHAALAEQVQSVRARANPFDALRGLGAWLAAPSQPVGYRTAALVVGTAIIAFALLRVSGLSDSTSRVANESRSGSIEYSGQEALIKNDVFGRSVDQLTLRVKRIELASVDPSLLTINRVLPDFEPADGLLPLDLPIRQIRLDVEAVRSRE
jgi:hypothetical protein